MYLAKGDRTREVEAAGLLHKYTDFLLFSLITHSLSRYLLLYATFLIQMKGKTIARLYHRVKATHRRHRSRIFRPFFNRKDQEYERAKASYSS